MKTTVAVVYHSGFGHTARVADAIARGAARRDVEVATIAVDAGGAIPDDAWAALAAADAIVMGSPTYMGTVSWQFKRFADATSKAWSVRAWRDKLFAGFTNSASMNGDKLSTLHYLMTLAMQHGGLWIGADTMPSNRKASRRDDPNWLGSFAGVMAQSPADASPDEGPPPGDLETARLFGERIAAAALQRVAAREPVAA